jgi:hypothetical protein
MVQRPSCERFNADPIVTRATQAQIEKSSCGNQPLLQSNAAPLQPCECLWQSRNLQSTNSENADTLTAILGEFLITDYGGMVKETRNGLICTNCWKIIT